MQVRLQKIISQASVTSRRKAEDLIREGRVRINGKTVFELGTKADPDRDTIDVDGKRIEPKQPKISVLLNKPDGYITSLRDPEGRPTVKKLVDNIPVRLYPVGRLDYHTEGLLIMTNDGELAQKIEHPSHALEKIYVAKVKGVPEENKINKLRAGIILEGRKTLPAKIKIIETRKNAWLEITIREGRQNQIRNMFEEIGHPVLKLKRVAIGAIRDDSLKPGEYRILKPQEIKILSGRGSHTGPLKKGKHS
ncbi:rRNA pseudouridine synthase [bacterium]|nr:rRNA pseudouridine synthase [bacterium]